jgi:hypothetical protein
MQKYKMTGCHLNISAALITKVDFSDDPDIGVVLTVKTESDDTDTLNLSIDFLKRWEPAENTMLVYDGKEFSVMSMQYFNDNYRKTVNTATLTPIVGVQACYGAESNDNDSEYREAMLTAAKHIHGMSESELGHQYMHLYRLNLIQADDKLRFEDQVNTLSNLVRDIREQYPDMQFPTMQETVKKHGHIHSYIKRFGNA